MAFPRVLFLSDGALEGKGGIGELFNLERLGLLSKIIRATGTEVVVAARWRIYPKFVSRLEQILRESTFASFSLTAINPAPEFDGASAALGWAERRYGEGVKGHPGMPAWVYLQSSKPDVGRSAAESGWHVLHTADGLTMDTAKQACRLLMASVAADNNDNMGGAQPSNTSQAGEFQRRRMESDRQRRGNAEALASIPDAAATAGGKVWVVSGNIFLRVQKSVASEVLQEGQDSLSLDATEAALHLIDPPATSEGDQRVSQHVA